MATRLLNETLEEVLRKYPSSAATEAAKMFQELHRFDEFENAIKTRWSQGDVQEFLEHVRGGRKRRGVRF